MKDSFVVKLLLILIAIAILFTLYTQYNKPSAKSPAKKENFTANHKKNHHRETFKQYKREDEIENFVSPIITEESRGIVDEESEFIIPSGTRSGSRTVRSLDPISDNAAIDFTVENKYEAPDQCFPKDRLTAEDLLPADAANTKWAQANPAGQGDVKNQNFLTAGFHIGVDTVGQSLRNPNYQLRSEPPNPKMSVSPCNQSTIEYDNSRRHFELGDC